MTGPALKKNGNSAIKSAPRQRLRHALWAAGFIALGLILLARNLGLVPPGPAAQALRFWPVLVIAIGLLLMASRVTLSAPLPAFAVERGSYESAHLHLSAGWADVLIAAFAGSSQLAVGQYPGYAGPRVRVDGSRAALSLDWRAASPFLAGPWSASLLKGLPWSLSLHSHAGHFNLNLRDLNVTGLDLRAGAGDVDLTLPALGQGEMALRLGLGDLTLRIPDGMAVRLRLSHGPLTQARLDEQRFIQTAPSEWVTPNFSACPQRFTLSIALGAGDLTLA